MASGLAVLLARQVLAVLVERTVEAELAALAAVIDNNGAQDAVPRLAGEMLGRDRRRR